MITFEQVKMLFGDKVADECFAEAQLVFGEAIRIEHILLVAIGKVLKAQSLRERYVPPGPSGNEYGF